GPFHRQLRLTTPLYVTKGTQLAAVLSSGGSCSVTPMQAWSSANDTRYAFGDAFIGGGAFWTPLGDLDPSRPDIPFHAIVDDGGRLLFEVFGRSESVPVSLNIGPNAGTVMFAGGSTDTASLFNATTTTINQLPPRRFGHESTLAAQRRRHTATALPDGRVLVVGGWDDRTGSAAGAIELYDPATNAWTTVAQLATPRFNHTAALVRYDAASRAQVLIAGGQTAWGAPPLSSSEIFVYDGAGSGTVIAGPPLNDPRAEHTALTLPNGSIAVIGGFGTPTNGIEIYTVDSGLGTFRRDAALLTPRSRHAAILLACPAGQPCAYGGKVLIVGGWLSNAFGPALTAELYDPDTHTVTNAGQSTIERAQFAAVQLANGQVLIAGGDQHGGTTLSSVELYDPSTQLFTVAGEMATPRGGVAAARLADDSVVLVGGWGASAASWGSADLIRPGNLVAAGVVNVGYNETIACAAPPCSFALVGGSLPPGVDLNASTGALAGLPQASGSFAITVGVVDASGRREIRPIRIQINGGMELESMALPPAVHGEPYQLRLIATGGASGRTWQLVGGALPDDIVLTPDGLVTGTPFQVGRFTFTVKASDAAGNSVQRDVTLPVHSPWTTTFPEGGVVNPGAFVQAGTATHAGLELRGLFSSADSGASWTGVTDAIAMLWPFDRTNVAVLAAGPGNTLYAVTNGHPFK